MKGRKKKKCEEKVLPKENSNKEGSIGVTIYGTINSVVIEKIRVDKSMGWAFVGLGGL